MEWTIKVNQEKQYVEIVTSGSVDKQGSLGMISAIVSSSSEYEIKNILIDHTQIQSVTGDTFDVFYRPRKFQELGGIVVIRIAEVIKQEHEDFFEFLETVYANRGLKFKVFFEKKNALQWLLDA